MVLFAFTNSKCFYVKELSAKSGLHFCDLSIWSNGLTNLPTKCLKRALQQLYFSVYVSTLDCGIIETFQDNLFYLAQPLLVSISSHHNYHIT